MLRKKRSSAEWKATRLGALALACALAVSAALVNGRAHAQGALVLLTDASAEPQNAEQQARAQAALARAFATQPAGSLLPPAAITERLAAHGYAEPGTAPSSPEVLARKADELLLAVAFGYDDETVVRGEVLLDTHARELHRMMDSDAVASAVTDICLYVVRALVHRGDHGRARSRARECWQLVPDLAPSAELHPPDVRALVAAAKNDAAGYLVLELGAAASALTPAPGEPAARCTLRVQGRALATPRLTLELPPGSYAVRVDCAQRGLTHRVQVVPAAATTLAVDTRFEQALSLAPQGLAYAGAAFDAESQRAHLSLLARMLDVSTLWTAELLPARAPGEDVAVLAAGSDAARPSYLLMRYRVEAGALVQLAERAVALAPESTLTPRLSRAIAALACAPTCAEPKDVAGGTSALAITTTALGGAAVLTSWALYARYATLDADLDPLTLSDESYGSTLDSRDAFGTAALITSSAGSVVLASAALAWAPEHDGVPWWAWASGAAGAAATTLGALLWLQHGELEAAPCDDAVAESCLRRSSRVPLGPMLVGQGLALASLPLSYALRSLAGSDEPTLELRADPSRLSLRYAGSF